MNAFFSAILSFIIPGLGQALSGDIKKGVIFFVIAIVLGIIVTYVLNNMFGYILNLAYAAYAAYDAYQMAQ